MSDRPFFDTNVLLYVLSGDLAKADRAEEILSQGGVVSVQVLNELAAVGTRKLRMSWTEVGEVLDTIQRICAVEPLTIETHQRAKAIAMRYGFHVYDAMIVAAALIAKARTLYSEDLQDGQRIEGVVIRNPFSRSR